MTTNYEGKTTAAARKLVVKELQSQDLIEKIKPHTLNFRAVRELMPLLNLISLINGLLKPAN